MKPVTKQKGVRQFTKEQEAYKHANYIGDEQEITSKSSFLWAWRQNVKNFFGFPYNPQIPAFALLIPTVNIYVGC